MNLFMMAPVIAMQGKIEDIARASRQFLMNAKIKPVTNAAKKQTTRATFSDKPCWIKSGIATFVNTPVQTEREEPRTGVGLNSGGDLTSANVIKEGNILAEDGFEI